LELEWKTYGFAVKIDSCAKQIYGAIVNGKMCTFFAQTNDGFGSKLAAFGLVET